MTRSECATVDGVTSAPRYYVVRVIAVRVSVVAYGTNKKY